MAPRPERVLTAQTTHAEPDGRFSPFRLCSPAPRPTLLARSSSTTVSTGRIRRSLVILSKTFVVLLGLLILFVLEENTRGWVGLQLYLHQLRSQGEKLTLAELELPKPPKANNGAAALLAAAGELQSLSCSCPLASEPPGTMKLVAPGKAQVLCKQPTLKGLNSNREWQVYEWGDLSRQLDEASIPLQHVREALRQPSLDLDLDYSQGFSLLLPHLNQAQNVARWLNSAALDDVHRGNLDETITNIAAIASLTKFQKNERLWISQLVRMAIGQIGLTMTWEALQAPGWNDDQLARLSEAWRAEHTFSDVVRTAEGERALTLVGFDSLRQHRSERMAEMGYRFDAVWEYGQWVRDYSQERARKFHVFLASELWTVLWSYQDECQALHWAQATLDTARTVEKRKSWTPVPLPPAANGCDDASLKCARFYFSNMAASPGLQDVLLKDLFFETQREMTRAAIAIKRCQLRTGKLPSDLATLVPEYLPELPYDWMDGNPLRYRLNPDGTFTLYSIGEDGKDHGGDPSFRTDRWRPGLWHGRDAVWPSPATD